MSDQPTELIPTAPVEPPVVHEPVPGKLYSFACTCGAEGDGTRENPEPWHMHEDEVAAAQLPPKAEREAAASAPEPEYSLGDPRLLDA